MEIIPCCRTYNLVEFFLERILRTILAVLTNNTKIYLENIVIIYKGLLVLNSASLENSVNYLFNFQLKKKERKVYTYS